CAARPKPRRSPASWRRKGGVRRRVSGIGRCLYPRREDINSGHHVTTGAVSARTPRPVMAAACSSAWLPGSHADMATDVEIERALATVTATLNDQELDDFDTKRVQQIVTESLGGEPAL